jgi:DNA-binding SARP family transcriptional activator
MDVSPVARVKLLDGFTVQLGDEVPGVTVHDLPPAAQRLVAQLCFVPKLPRDAVAGSLWPEVSEEHAHGSLRSALWRLRRSAPGLVESSEGALALADDVAVDVRELYAWARRAVAPGAELDDVAVPEAGLSGNLLPGWYEDWVLLERERLRQLRLHALELVAERLAVAGRYGEALHVAYAAIGAEPLRESAHRTVVRVHLEEGNVAEALRAFESFTLLLGRELGVRPTARMTELVAAIRAPAAASV